MKFCGKCWITEDNKFQFIEQLNKPAKYFDLKQNGDNLYEILHSELYVHLAFPQLSKKIQNYIAERGDIEIIRCCTPSWKVKFYEGKMPEDGIWSICHNCTNIAEEYFHVEMFTQYGSLSTGTGSSFSCLDGLKMGNVDGRHIAQMLFGEE